MPGSGSYDKHDLRRLQNWTFPELKLTPEQRTKIGARAIQVIRARITAALNVEDQTAKAYSPRGPIYVPLTYGATFQTAGRVRAKLQAARTARSLHGAFSVTRGQYLNYLEAQGYQVKVKGRILGPYRLLKTSKFADYEEFKQFLGHSGERDLSLSGRMLGNITIVQDSEDEVVIGFGSVEQERKMRGNMKHDVQWGFSPNDKANIMPVIEEAIRENLGEMFWT